MMKQVYDKIVEDYKAFSSKLEVSDIQFVPISALVRRQCRAPFRKYAVVSGCNAYAHAGDRHIESDYNHIDSRFPVQYVIRPQSKEYPDFRGYAGRVAGGIFRPGEEVLVLPSGFTSKIKSIELGGQPLEEAFAPMSVTMTLEDEIDISRGDIIAKPNNHPQSEQDIDLMLCWMNQRPVNLNTKFYIRHNTKEVRGVLKEIQYKLDINSLHRLENVDQLDDE